MYASSSSVNPTSLAHADNEGDVHLEGTSHGHHLEGEGTSHGHHVTCVISVKKLDDCQGELYLRLCNEGRDDKRPEGIHWSKLESTWKKEKLDFS
ncbi:hypothetical protein TNCV_3893211 [Trichonephila clavipes]|nr:hypothetical protein TNCV_3893211 [Trichonephila clavipes]